MRSVCKTRKRGKIVTDGGDAGQKEQDRDHNNRIKILRRERTKTFAVSGGRLIGERTGKKKGTKRW